MKFYQLMTLIYSNLITLSNQTTLA